MVRRQTDRDKVKDKLKKNQNKGLRVKAGTKTHFKVLMSSKLYMFHTACPRSLNPICIVVTHYIKMGQVFLVRKSAD